MKNKASQLKKIDQKFSKNILFTLVIILDFLLGMTVFVSIIENGLKRALFSDNSIQNYIFILICILLSILLYTKLISKKSRNSYSIMKKFCSYKKLGEFTQEEEFKQIIYYGVEKVYESRLWLIIGEVFVPKNFIVCAYLRKGTREVYTIHLILIDGSVVYYTAASYNNHLEEIKTILRRSIKQLIIFDNRNLISEKLRKELSSRYENYKNHGKDYAELISKWNSEFDIKDLL